MSPITEITLERFPGMAPDLPLPYALVLKSDGTALYISASPTIRKGTFTASLKPADFQRLAQHLEKAGFFQLEDFYGPSAFDIPETWLSAIKDGKRKRILDSAVKKEYRNQAPRALQQLEDELHRISQQLPWKQVSQEYKWPDTEPK
jgi:Domain of unknown function (DUF6438)